MLSKYTNGNGIELKTMCAGLCGVQFILDVECVASPLQPRRCPLTLSRENKRCSCFCGPASPARGSPRNTEYLHQRTYSQSICLDGEKNYRERDRVVGTTLAQQP